MQFRTYASPLYINDAQVVYSTQAQSNLLVSNVYTKFATFIKLHFFMEYCIQNKLLG